ncbi:hypothetical protein HPB47_001624 [Ixodes persulcatus]|uniref:Uncharacterized protein n=1 Tax=Ixodes persulcatus TaxID=34615 RepID=A0AC60PPA3_IXOPE|nr:hypothetical protein HPB47_001624 [Ixodes persulcatus]
MNEDFWVGLVNYRCAPLEDGRAPCELLMGRRLHGRRPDFGVLPAPQVRKHHGWAEILKNGKQAAALMIVQGSTRQLSNRHRLAIWPCIVIDARYLGEDRAGSLSEKQRSRDESQVYEFWVGTARPRLASFLGFGSPEQRVTFTSADDVPLSRAILRAHPQAHSNIC